MRPKWYAHCHRAARAVFWLGIALLPVAADAAGVLSKPVLGYVFEPAGKTIRAIAGVPGAAVLDEPVPTATKLEAAFAAPGKAFAVGEALGADASMVLRWEGKALEATALPGALRDASLVAFSSSGAAAVYYPTAGKIQVWRGLPAAPSLSNTFDAASVSALAISDDGEQVAASGDSGVTLFDASEGRLIAGGTFSALAFMHGSHDLLAAEPALDRVVRLSNGELTEFAPLAAARTLAASRDGKWIALGGANGLQLMRSSGGEAIQIPCEGAVESASPLSGDAVFLVRVAGGGLWVLDMDGGEPRFVLAGGVQ